MRRNDVDASVAWSAPNWARRRSKRANPVVRADHQQQDPDADRRRRPAPLRRPTSATPAVRSGSVSARRSAGQPGVGGQSAGDAGRAEVRRAERWPAPRRQADDRADGEAGAEDGGDDQRGRRSLLRPACGRVGSWSNPGRSPAETSAVRRPGRVDGRPPSGNSAGECPSNVESTIDTEPDRAPRRRTPGCRQGSVGSGGPPRAWCTPSPASSPRRWCSRRSAGHRPRPTEEASPNGAIKTIAGSPGGAAAAVGPRAVDAAVCGVACDVGDASRAVTTPRRRRSGSGTSSAPSSTRPSPSRRSRWPSPVERRQFGAAANGNSKVTNLTARVMGNGIGRWRDRSRRRGRDRRRHLPLRQGPHAGRRGRARPVGDVSGADPCGTGGSARWARSAAGSRSGVIGFFLVRGGDHVRPEPSDRSRRRVASPRRGDRGACSWWRSSRSASSPTACSAWPRSPIDGCSRPERTVRSKGILPCSSNPTSSDPTSTGPLARTRRFGERWTAGRHPCLGPPGLTIVVVGYVGMVARAHRRRRAHRAHWAVLAGLRQWDDDVTSWMADHRTGVPRRPSPASCPALADTMGVIVDRPLVEIVLVVRDDGGRCWSCRSVSVSSSLTFLTVNAIVDRPRPDVPKLGSEPSTSSFPSGHIAATVVLWGAVVLLFCSASTYRWVRATAYTIVVVLASPSAPPASTAACTTPPTSSSGGLMGVSGARHDVLAVRVTSADEPCPSSPRRPAREPAVAAARGALPAVSTVTTVAVIAHTRKQLGGGLTELREVLAAHGVDDTAVVRGVEEQTGTETARAALEAAVPTSCSSGAATGWCNVAPTCSPAPAPRWRSSPPARRTSSPPTWHPQGRRRRRAGRPERAPSARPRRRADQRRAIPRDGRCRVRCVHDP